MDGHELTVHVTADGLVCVLAVRGELDLLAAEEFLSQVAQAVADSARAGSGQAGRLVLELAGVRFLDCAGARALASVTGLVPAECPLIVRSISPEAARVLDLLGLNLEHLPVAAAAQASADEVSALVRQSRTVRAASEDVFGQLIGTAEAVAQTEDRIAATMARLAAQRPHRAARLGALAEQARSYATSIRRQADESSRRAMESSR